MKIGIVESKWVSEESHRLDCNPFLQGAAEAKRLLWDANLKKNSLLSLASEIFHAGRYKRIWLQTPEHSTRFLSSTDILQADLQRLTRIATSSVKVNPKLTLKKGQVLITRSGTIGRISYVSENMENLACTEDVLRVSIDESRIGSGYLYAFFKSKFGLPIILSGTYGAIIKHIEAEHIQDMPVPRLTEVKESKIDQLIRRSYQLRDTYQEKLNEATKLLFERAGLQELEPHEWHLDDSDKGFVASNVSYRSLRAWNYSKRAEVLIEKLRSVNHSSIGEICEYGRFSRGPRFKRTESDEGYGALLIGQKQGFWSRPEGKWINTARAPTDIFVTDETILVSAQGGLGERVCFTRPIFVTGNWVKHAYSEHFLRLVSGDSKLSTAYIFAFLRSEFAFRCLRSFAIGSMQQDIHVGMLAELPIPVIDLSSIKTIEQLVREAHKSKDLADGLEDEAINLLEQSIEAAAPKH